MANTEDIPTWPAVEGLLAQIRTASVEQADQYVAALHREAGRNSWMKHEGDGWTEGTAPYDKEAEIWWFMHSLCFELAVDAAVVHRNVADDAMAATAAQAAQDAVDAAGLRAPAGWATFPFGPVLMAVLTWDLAVDSDDPRNDFFPYLSYEPRHRAVLVRSWFQTFGVPDGLTCTPKDYELPLFEWWPFKPDWFDRLTPR